MGSSFAAFSVAIIEFVLHWMGKCGVAANPGEGYFSPFRKILASSSDSRFLGFDGEMGNFIWVE